MALHRAALAILAGCGYFLGFVGFGLWPLTFVFLVPLLFSIRGVSPRAALGWGCLAGLVANLGGYYWVIHLLTQFADLSLPLAVLGYVLLSAYQGALLGVATYLVRRGELHLGWSPVLTLPSALVLAEWVYPLLFPSFVGNGFYAQTWLTQAVDLFGMLGLDACIAAINATLFVALVAKFEKRSIPRIVGLGPAILLFLVGYSGLRLPSVDAALKDARRLKVAVVQTNLGARDKADKRDEFIARHRRMSEAALLEHPDLDLVVWPESAYNRWIHRRTPNLTEAVTGGLKVPLIFGALTWQEGQGEREVYNTALATDAKGDVIGRFDKVMLLAFGETIPLVDTFPFIKQWLPRSSTFTTGRTFQNFEIGSTKLLPMICYEDIIPSFVRQMWQKAGPADVLVNVTNDSWYGDTQEPLIHLALATFRSIETRRALIRSTNTGISAIVDPAGRITARTGQWTQETLIALVPLIQNGESTPYMVIGDLVAWVALALLCFGILKARRLASSDRATPR